MWASVSALSWLYQPKNVSRHCQMFPKLLLMERTSIVNLQQKYTFLNDLLSFIVTHDHDGGKLHIVGSVTASSSVHLCESGCELNLTYTVLLHSISLNYFWWEPKGQNLLILSSISFNCPIHTPPIHILFPFILPLELDPYKHALAQNLVFF